MTRQLRHEEALDGRIFSEQRSLNMTETAPPETYQWYHRHPGSKLGDGDPSTPIVDQTQDEWRELRLTFLDQFTMTVTEEGKYRWWRWVDDTGKVRWSERRLLTDPMPATPGLWPANS